MTEKDDQNLNFLLDSFDVDQSRERLAGLEARIMADIADDAENAQGLDGAFFPHLGWIQGLEAAALSMMVAIGILFAANIMSSDSFYADLSSLYYTNSYTYMGG